jgi:hypothetical protein
MSLLLLLLRLRLLLLQVMQLVEQLLLLEPALLT